MKRLTVGKLDQSSIYAHMVLSGLIILGRLENLHTFLKLTRVSKGALFIIADRVIHS